MCKKEQEKVLRELGKSFDPQFDKNGLLPVIVQQHDSKKVLMFAYMNKQALQKTLQCRQAVFYSRSRRCLWHKGKVSGAIQNIVSMRIDCDQDCLLLSVRPALQAACHNGFESCFYRDVMGNDLVYNETFKKNDVSKTETET